MAAMLSPQLLARPMPEGTPIPHPRSTASPLVPSNPPARVSA